MDSKPVTRYPATQMQDERRRMYENARRMSDRCKDSVLRARENLDQAHARLKRALPNGLLSE